MADIGEALWQHSLADTRTAMSAAWDLAGVMAKGMVGMLDVLVASRGRVRQGSHWLA